MKLALFSQKITNQHTEELKKFLKKDLNEIKFLYIITPQNYKPYLPDWAVESENRWRGIFPLFRQFDIERAYKVDPDFNFKEYFSTFDFLYVSGGNTFVLSYWMKESGAAETLKHLINSDQIVYGGASAGAIYTYSDLEPVSLVDDPTKAPRQINEGLGIVDYVVIPHWQDPEFQLKLVEMRKIYQERDVKTIEITDDQGLFIENENFMII